ncbi:MAG TPA: Mur ligase domain-containing protein, partial [Jiangellaceae bacterium]
MAQLLRQRAADVADVTVTGISHDSRQIYPGDLFAALPGANTHGAAFIEAAAAAGAVAVLTDTAGAQQARGLPVIELSDPRSHVGQVAAFIYGEPARDLLMLGITGTNGKTTTAYLVESGLQAAGHRAG